MTGLRDDYRHDGRVLFEILEQNAIAPKLRGHEQTLTQLAQVYKQLDAPVGAFGMSTVAGATRAMETGNTSDDSRYVTFDQRLSALTGRRDAVALQISMLLEAAAFDSRTLDEPSAKALIRQAEAILAQASALATG